MLDPAPFLITLDNIGKRYNKEWIFRGVNRSLKQGSAYAFIGHNGSGKSTLLQLVAGAIAQSEGTITYSFQGKVLPAEEVFRSISIASPYLELIEEFTLAEAIEFQSHFKPFLPGLSHKDIIELSDLQKAQGKLIKYYSSGMKQRAKLTLALLADTPLLLLDEPASHLDRSAVAWYKELVKQYAGNRICIVCSNQQEEEYFFCTEQLNIEDYK